VPQARGLVPDHAMAYVVESELEDQRASLGWMEDPAQGLRQAERAARHAIGLNDPGANARADAQLGRIHAIRGEYAQALAEVRRLQPNFPLVEFGNRFADPAARARLQLALRKAGGDGLGRGCGLGGS